MQKSFSILMATLSVCVLTSAVHGVTVDLTTVDGTTGDPNGSGFANDALFKQSFLVFADARISSNDINMLFGISTNSGVEAGYNSDPQTLDTTPGAQAALVNDMTARKVDGVWYYEFIVKLNEAAGAAAPINIDEIRFYTSPTAGISTTVLDDLGTLRWSLDGDEDNTILMDYLLTGPSAISIVYYVPLENFTGALVTDSLYIYTEMSLASAGSEETGIYTSAYVGDIVDGTLVPEPESGFMVSDYPDAPLGTIPNEVPEPATMSLLILGGIAMLRRRKN